MLHGLEDCRTLGVDDAFQSELREGPPWKTACERPHLAESGLRFFLSRRRLIRILFIELSAAKLRAFSILLQLRNERDRKPVRVFEARIP